MSYCICICLTSFSWKHDSLDLHALCFSRAIAMATMKSQASSSSSFTYRWTYDVFISFRGVDTRLGFTGNLFKALRDTKEVNVFMDDEYLKPGEEITPTLDKAIQESRIALVIFSRNYASSTYCLEELAKIMECSKEKGMLVWPVFYHINPTEVRHQKGSYAEALAKHEARNYEKQKLEKWKLALEKAASLSGWHFRPDGDKYEYQFIDNINQSISKKISSLRASDNNQISTMNAEHPEEKEVPTGEDKNTKGQVALMNQEVALSASEEDEDPLLVLKGKLYSFDKDGDLWNDQGIGIVKFLKNKVTGDVRLLVRQSKSLKISANHLILPAMIVEEHAGNDKSCVWRAVDFADGEILKNEVFCFRFASIENCKMFMETFREIVESQKKEENKDASAATGLLDKLSIERKVDAKKKDEEKSGNK